MTRFNILLIMTFVCITPSYSFAEELVNCQRDTTTGLITCDDGSVFKGKFEKMKEDSSLKGKSAPIAIVPESSNAKKKRHQDEDHRERDKEVDIIVNEL